jgi:NAD(P)H-dependent flavin oxidoreductase YrpB (nitropropane dioxygenase family)
MSKNPLQTKFTEMMGIEFPIIAFTHCKDVVAAVVNAGGFAVLGEAMHTPDDIAADIKWIRSRVGDKPFGIDLVLPASAPGADTLEKLLAGIPEEHRKFAQHIKEKYKVPEPKAGQALHQWGGLNQEIARRQLDVILEERVPVFISGLGSPAFMLKTAHERGMKVFGLIGKTRQAKREIEAGVDVIIAQGYDAAGHTGPIGTFSIVPEVVAIAGDVPVVAAGGVTTGRHLAASLCLGASGVWTGTLWLACRESDSDMIIKEKLIAATSDDTVYSRSVSGFPMRVTKCPWTEEWASPEAPRTLPSPYQMLLSSDYIQAANDHRRADLMFEAAGQGVGFVDAMKPARQIVFDLVEEALATFEELTGELSGS